MLVWLVICQTMFALIVFVFCLVGCLFCLIGLLLWLDVSLVVCYGGGGVVLEATLPEQIPEFMSDSCAPNIKISDYVPAEGNNSTKYVK